MEHNDKIDKLEDAIAEPNLQEELIQEINEENKRNPLYKRLAIGFAVLLIIAFGLTWFLNNPPKEAYSGVTDFLETIFNKDLIGYLIVGLLAQMVDGALGMAYGATATSFLVSIGVTTINASASIHIAEVFTTGASGLSHLKFGNVNKKLFKNLLIPGIIGAVLGALILSLLEKGTLFSEDDVKKYIRPVTMVYTMILGIIVLRKALIKVQPKNKITKVTPLAFFGGFMDSIGGGGWGPIVTSTLISSGRAINYTIGSVNLAEFFIALSSSLTFIVFAGLDPGLWQVIIGLIIGGVFAAPFAALLVNKVKKKPLMIFVGCFIIFLSLTTLVKLAFNVDLFKNFAGFITNLF
ncbi:sulfite exporter TauE/SafE family protein [Cytophaga aurantiaca]|uniref:sulfite exporter TauE/SafE family protein n=1 Tax=Cytophaga aurantiaca TaxID=29530 RepID=UPI000375F0F8|nr:sulfite exporter TauE/SafE family protein [Cytophaga aurantiaca]